LRGACQRLANGNTLITLSDKGRVLEVTQEGEIVWEFWNETDRERNMRRAVYRMMRVPPQIASSLPLADATNPPDE